MLCIVHGAGGESDTRSHFEAQDLMEHGGFVAGGWVAPGSDDGTVVVRLGNVGRVIPSDPHAASNSSREVAMTAEQRRMFTSCRTTPGNGSPTWGEPIRPSRRAAARCARW